jgi:hypothetical protein
MSSSNGPANSMIKRNESEPHRSISDIGSTMFPFCLGHRTRRRRSPGPGSSSGERLDEPDQSEVVESLREEPAVHEVQDRVLDPARVLIRRHPHVDVLRRNGVLGPGEQYRKKYQDESTNVSMVSVSRRASPPHVGHATFDQVGCRASGDSSRLEVDVVGQQDRQLVVGHATSPHVSQWMMGIGAPQYR